MQLAFATPSIRATCESSAVARRALGHERARVLRARISDLWAAESMLDLPAGRPVPCDRRARRMRLPLSGGFCLIIVPNQRKVPKRRDGRVNWERVYRIKIEAIEEPNAD